jgi:hypothetical protein
MGVNEMIHRLQGFRNPATGGHGDVRSQPGHVVRGRIFLVVGLRRRVDHATIPARRKKEAATAGQKRRSMSASTAGRPWRFRMIETPRHSA